MARLGELLRAMGVEPLVRRVLDLIARGPAKMENLDKAALFVFDQTDGGAWVPHMMPKGPPLSYVFTRGESQSKAEAGQFLNEGDYASSTFKRLPYIVSEPLEAWLQEQGYTATYASVKVPDAAGSNPMRAGYTADVVQVKW
jgi:hypothetical protein